MRRVIIIIVLFVVCAQLGFAVPQEMVTFSGYTWNVKSGSGGPGPNKWEDRASAVFVDPQGLHLTVGLREGKWYSSEVYLPASLGYGTYSFEIGSDVTLVDTNLVGAVFLYEDDTHEIDVEFSQWGGKIVENAQFVMQPFDVTGNMKRFTLGSGSGVVQRIIWEPTRVVFELLQEGKIVQTWEYTGNNNFVQGKERVHINFWQYKGLAPSDGLGKEFIVKKFTFTPLVTDEAICSVIKDQKGKVVEKRFLSSLAKMLKGYFG